MYWQPFQGVDIPLYTEVSSFQGVRIECIQRCQRSIDCSSLQDSSIIDFYPTDFRIDLNGKKYAWQGVALLPFVDEEWLHKVLASLYSEQLISAV